MLQQKRERERRRYERIKNDPVKWQELREKQRIIYLRKKEKCSRKLVEDMNLRRAMEGILFYVPK